MPKASELGEPSQWGQSYQVGTCSPQILKGKTKSFINCVRVRVEFGYLSGLI